MDASRAVLTFQLLTRRIAHPRQSASPLIWRDETNRDKLARDELRNQQKGVVARGSRFPRALPQPH